MPRGIIKSICNKELGFILDEAGNELFFHRSSVENADFDEMTEHQQVSYEIFDGPNGPRAEHVQTISKQT